MPATAAAIMNGHTVKLDSAEGRVFQEKKTEPAGDVNVAEVDEEADRREELAAGECSCGSILSTTTADSRTPLYPQLTPRRSTSPSTRF